MARTVKDDDERERRVILVGELFDETGLSTRKLAVLISNNYFPISNCTVSDYLQRYCKMRPQEMEKIREKVHNNTSESIEEERVRTRVEQNIKLFVGNFTIDEIAKSTNESFWTVYRDLTVRAKSINKDYYETVIKPKLLEHAKENINHGKNV